MLALHRNAARIGLFAVVTTILLFLSTQYDSASFNRYISTPSRSRQERVDLVVKLQVLKHVLAERFPVDVWRKARRLNGPALDRLSDCVLADNCGPGENTVIILGSVHFGSAVFGRVSGEDIWAHSSLVAFNNLNYTLLYGYGMLDVLTIYQAIPDLVPIVILEASSLTDCIARNGSTAPAPVNPADGTGSWQETIGCIKRDGFEEGIPIWKAFAFHFWGNPMSPLGGNWTLSPEDYGRWRPGKGNHFLGYAVEDRCTKIPVQTEREHRGLILAKRPEMFEGKEFAWEGLLDGVAKRVPKSDQGQDFVFVSTAGKSAADGGPESLAEKGVVSMGRMPQMEWWSEVAKSKVMLGIGWPALSPSPYDALCFGVPFINVIKRRDTENPHDKSKWLTMHDALLPLEPPYVYHVLQHDEEGLQEALDQAVSTPIGRFIPPWMTLEAVRDRHKNLVEHDWRSSAVEVFAAKWKDGDSPFLL